MTATTTTDSHNTTDVARRMEAGYAKTATAARDSLAYLATEATVDALAELVNTIAKAQAATAIAHMAAGIAEQAEDDDTAKANVLEYMTDVLVQGADDRWSGRNNDLARTAHDGRLAAINDIRNRLGR